LQFSPDGRQLLTSGSRIWNSSTGALWKDLADSLTSEASYSLDGRRAVTSGEGGDRPPRVWDVETGNPIATLEQQGLFLSVTFSPDAVLVAGSDEYGNITIWTAATGTVLRSIQGPTAAPIMRLDKAVYGVEFSPDGKRLLATGPGYALLWNVELDHRSPAEVDAVVAEKSPWRLVDGRLTPRAP
jgi:WD40 repeat protein